MAASKLVVVESPAKTESISNYLGPDYKVLASYGHVRDLVAKNGSVDPDNEFKMRYELSDSGRRNIDNMNAALKNADTLLLATDPDREGESIAWHIERCLQKRGALNGVSVKRISFNRLTKAAVKEAVESPGELALPLVAAQEARRALDFLVGFNLSPVLWKKVGKGLSAGRVQSPTLRLIVEREEEIKNFKSQNYWQFTATWGVSEGDEITAALQQFKGNKVTKFSVTDKELSEEWKKELTEMANDQMTVTSVERKDSFRKPPPPYTTSSLQQDAATRLKFSSKKTMEVAQKLYEGIDVGNGSSGLITYMRTDSVALSLEAVGDIRGYIENKFGIELLPEKPNKYSGKSKNAQEAHEAVRVTFVEHEPEAIEEHLTADQYKLYDLIWRRTVACQMISKKLEQLTILFDVSEGTSFKTVGSKTIDPGFTTLFEDSKNMPAAQKGKSDANDDDDPSETEKELPAVNVGDVVKVIEFRAHGKKTKPPLRYTEARLLKKLEYFGIGRPSTYASIIETIKKRDYVELKRSKFHPTETGTKTIAFLSEHFDDYIAYSYTSDLEDDLDAVSRGERTKLEVLDGFWSGLSTAIKEKTSELPDVVAPELRQLGTDAAGLMVSVGTGKFGDFVKIGDRGDKGNKMQSLPDSLDAESVTLEEALRVLEYPIDLGIDDGFNYFVNEGKYGHYVCKQKGKKRVYASVDDDVDPKGLSLQNGIDMVKAKEDAISKSVLKTFEDEGNKKIMIKDGKYGPYVTNGNKNTTVPAEFRDNIEGISLEQATEWIKKKKTKRSAKKQ